MPTLAPRISKFLPISLKKVETISILTEKIKSLSTDKCCPRFARYLLQNLGFIKIIVVTVEGFIILNPFQATWKRRKNWFADVFRGFRNGTFAWNGLDLESRIYYCSYTLYCITASAYLYFTVSHMSESYFLGFN